MALACGYLLARLRDPELWKLIQRQFSRPHAMTDWSNLRTYNALTSLFNDQPDEALDSFVAHLPVNNETLEMHFALGALLRRRGELERAVRVHQNVGQSGALTADQVHSVQLELARDYLESGLYDRAEAILQPLVDHLGVAQVTRVQAMQHLVGIYQEFQEWLKAIDIADRLTSKKFAQEADHWRCLQAHFACELASQALANHEYDMARQKIRSALDRDPDCARANILNAELALIENNRVAARTALNTAFAQDSALIAEIIAPLSRCYSDGEQDSYLQMLLRWQNQFPSLFLLVQVLDLMRIAKDNARALDYCQEQLARFPALATEAAFLQLAINERGRDTCGEMLALIKKMVMGKLVQHCSSCGYEASKMTWRCPSCGDWATIRVVERGSKLHHILR